MGPQMMLGLSFPFAGADSNEVTGLAAPVCWYAKVRTGSREVMGLPWLLTNQLSARLTVGASPPLVSRIVVLLSEPRLLKFPTFTLIAAPVVFCMVRTDRTTALFDEKKSCALTVRPKIVSGGPVTVLPVTSGAPPVLL